MTNMSTVKSMQHKNLGQTELTLVNFSLLQTINKDAIYLLNKNQNNNCIAY